MELKEQGKDWCLTARDATVNLIQIDFRLSLFLADPQNEATIVIETPCRLKTRDTSVVLRPAETSTLAPILPFFNARVTGVAIRSTGALKLYFRGGPTLEVDADPNYEAWQLASSTMGLLFVCSPGGAVSLFKDH